MDWGVKSTCIKVREALKKYYLDREIVPISSDTPTIGPVSEHLDREQVGLSRATLDPQVKFFHFNLAPMKLPHQKLLWPKRIE